MADVSEERWCVVFGRIGGRDPQVVTTRGVGHDLDIRTEHEIDVDVRCRGGDQPIVFNLPHRAVAHEL